MTFTRLMIVLILTLMISPLTAREPGMLPLNEDGDEVDQRPAYLGVMLSGMQITEVMPNSSAKGMALKAGDVLVAWCSDPKADKESWMALQTIDDLKDRLAAHKIGDVVKLKVNRSGQELVVQGALKPRPNLETTGARPPRIRGIQGQAAPAWKVTDWFQADEDNPPELDDYKGKVVVVYCFQHWCPGCHSYGLPLMQRAEKALKANNDVEFVYLQTVFEGAAANTFENGVNDIKKFGLKGPFGQTSMVNGRSSFMLDYKTGGTPWIVVIDPKGVVRFNGFRFKEEGAQPVRNLDEAAKQFVDYVGSLTLDHQLDKPDPKNEAPSND